MQPQKVRVIEGGKLVIPAAMRRELGIAAGATVLVDVSDGELRVRSLARGIARAQELVRQFRTPGVSMTDKLIADRRRESERE